MGAIGPAPDREPLRAGRLVELAIQLLGVDTGIPKDVGAKIDQEGRQATSLPPLLFSCNERSAELVVDMDTDNLVEGRIRLESEG